MVVKETNKMKTSGGGGSDPSHLSFRMADVVGEMVSLGMGQYHQLHVLSTYLLGARY